MCVCQKQKQTRQSERRRLVPTLDLVSDLNASGNSLNSQHSTPVVTSSSDDNFDTNLERNMNELATNVANGTYNDNKVRFVRCSHCLFFCIAYCVILTTLKFNLLARSFIRFMKFRFRKFQNLIIYTLVTFFSLRFFLFFFSRISYSLFLVIKQTFEYHSLSLKTSNIKATQTRSLSPNQI